MWRGRLRSCPAHTTPGGAGQKNIAGPALLVSASPRRSDPEGSFPVLRQAEGRRQGRAAAAYRTNARTHPATAGGLGAAGYEGVQPRFSIRKSQGEKREKIAQAKQRLLAHPTSKFHLFFGNQIAIAWIQ